jgi:cytochrome P450
MTTSTQRPSIFDATLPTVDYGDGRDPDEAHRVIRVARQHAPIAFGPYGPELLDYELVRTMLRDSRFVMPRGIGLVVQGITSGPVWDRVGNLLVSLNGAEHHRLRRLVARAFTPRAAGRMRAACVDAINELVDPVAVVGHCDLGPVSVPAGAFVMASTAAANRDPAMYDDPERLDITRSDPPAMLTFGGGVHYCLGAHLARVELAEALTVLGRRMPNLRRTGPAPWKSIFEISGPTTLPIAFDAGH